MMHLSNDLKLDRKMRKELSKPFGIILGGRDIASVMKRGQETYAVGDATVSTLLELGHIPKVAIFDYMTGRMPVSFPAIKKVFKKPVNVDNPSGMITTDLWDAVRAASKSRRPVGIRVRGEEDLAALACIYFAKRGDLVMYGMMKRGIAVIKVNTKMKNYVGKMLQKMAEIGKD